MDKSLVKIAWKVLKSTGATPYNVKVVFRHSFITAILSIDIAKFLNLNINDVILPALLHDTGRLLPLNHFILHGIKGRDFILKSSILKSYNVELIASTCENHIGCGITRQDIIEQNLPLPLKEYVPKNLIELIVSFADNLLYGETFIGYLNAKLRFKKELGIKYSQRLEVQLKKLGGESLLKYLNQEGWKAIS